VIGAIMFAVDAYARGRQKPRIRRVAGLWWCETRDCIGRGVTVQAAYSHWQRTLLRLYS
jgi:hypothetical protein